MPPLSRSRDHRLSAWRSGPSAYELMTEVRRAEPSTSLVSGSMTHDTRTDDLTEASGALLLRRSLLGGLGLAAIGGLTAGALGLTGNAATPRTLLAAATPTATHDPTHAVAVASPSATPP